MARSIARYLRNLPKASGVRYTERVWYPPADVYQTREGWIVKVELAGVRLDDLEIVIEGSELRVSGSRRDTSCNDCVSFHQLEITYSRFEKIIRFPRRVEGSSVATIYEDGLLIISLQNI